MAPFLYQMKLRWSVVAFLTWLIFYDIPVISGVPGNVYFSRGDTSYAFNIPENTGLFVI